MKNWIIVGASRGLGRVWTTAALERGDRVVACVRTASAVDDLVERYGDQITPVYIEMSDPGAIRNAIEKARLAIGTVDVVVNSVGYGLFGAVEEVSEEQARHVMEVNFFGALWLSRAILPVFRAQRRGHLIHVSSVAGLVAYDFLGLYCASKWALEGLLESLSKEVREFGVVVTLIEPGPYATDWGGISAVWAAPTEHYSRARAARIKSSADIRLDDPLSAAQEMMRLVDCSAPPTRLLLGTNVMAELTNEYDRRVQEWSRPDFATSTGNRRTARNLE